MQEVLRPASRARPPSSGWFSGKAPFALSVVSTGTWASSANFSELAGGVGVVDALADVEQRVLRREQRLDGGLHVVGIGARAPALHRRVGMLVGVVLAEVARNDEQHRARAAPTGGA